MSYRYTIQACIDPEGSRDQRLEGRNVQYLVFSGVILSFKSIDSIFSMIAV